MKLFKKHPSEGKAKPKQIAIEDQEDRLEEEMVELTEKESGRRVDQVLSEVDTEIKRAAEQAVKEVQLLGEGRCPRCAKRVEIFLFTTVCPACGWSSYITPEKGKAVLHLKSGREVVCERVFQIDGGDILCITNSVASHRVPLENLDFIEYKWLQSELDEKRREFERESTRICSWCEREFDKNDPEKRVTYIAFGVHQEKHIFCCEKCLESFKRQFPPRIHRNCYEVDCSTCDLCKKRYETHDKYLPQPETPGV